jgi:PEP-CTERM motif
MPTIRKLISYLPVVLLVNLFSSVGNATTIDTFSFTQGGYTNGGIILSGTFTGTVNSNGFIELADLSNFSDTFEYVSGLLTVTDLGYLTGLSLFSFNAQSPIDSGSLDFAGQVGLGANLCVGGAAAFGSCGGTGSRGAYANSFFTDEAPVVTLVSSITSGVPEPSTWAMMLLGFAGIGFMAYLRKSKPALMIG